MEEKKANIQLSEERLNRYREKQDLLNQYLKHLENWIKGVSKAEFSSPSTIKDRFSIFYVYQLITEIISDLCAMMIRI